LFQESTAFILTYLAKRTKPQFGACAGVQIPDYGTELWSPGCRNVSIKHCYFIIYLPKRARTQSGACAVVQFPDYGRELWSPGSKKLFQESLAISASILPRE
jgi:hypothetical protein